MFSLCNCHKEGNGGGALPEGHTPVARIPVEIPFPISRVPIQFLGLKMSCEKWEMRCEHSKSLFPVSDFSLLISFISHKNLFIIQLTSFFLLPNDNILVRHAKRNVTQISFIMHEILASG